MPTRREATILSVALVLLFVYFSRSSPAPSATTPPQRSSLQGLRELVLGPSLPDYSRELGTEFARAMQGSLNKWHAHEPLKLRAAGAVRDARVHWGDRVPATRIVTHVPGWTVLDNVLVFKGSIYIVTDNSAAFPPMPSLSDWWQVHFINTTKAREFGSYAGTIDGVSWLCTDDPKDISRMHLVGLQRMHSAFSADVPPSRIVIPRAPGPRAPVGMDSSMLHRAFPGASVWLQPEWNDFGDIIKPWVYERMVLASARAAGAPALPWWGAPLFVPAPDAWWSTVRGRVQSTLPTAQVARSVDGERPVVVYVTRGRPGMRLGGRTRAQLLDGLEALDAELYVLDPSTPADVLLALTGRANVVLGTPSGALDDAALFLASGAALFEFFPPGVMHYDHALTVGQGVEYVAWWGSKSFSGASALPAARDVRTEPENPADGEDIPLDVEAVLGAISARISLDL